MSNDNSHFNSHTIRKGSACLCLKCSVQTHWHTSKLQEARQYTYKITRARSRNRLWQGKETMLSLCIVEVHIFVSTTANIVPYRDNATVHHLVTCRSKKCKAIEFCHGKPTVASVCVLGELVNVSYCLLTKMFSRNILIFLSDFKQICIFDIFS